MTATLISIGQALVDAQGVDRVLESYGLRPTPDREEMLELIGQQAILWGDANHDGTLN